jgi:hypothetical protein
VGLGLSTEAKLFKLGKTSPCLYLTASYYYFRCNECSEYLFGTNMLSFKRLGFRVLIRNI